MNKLTQTALFGALAAATAAASIAGLVNLNTGARVGAGPVAVGFAEGYDAAGLQRFTAAQPAMDQSATDQSADLAKAERLARQALQLSPYASGARLRLVHIDLIRNGRVTPPGLRELERSYDLVPIDPDVATWRIRFGLETWSQLSPKARQAVKAEAKALYPLGGREIDVRSVLTSIEDPAGKLTAALWQHSWSRR